MIPWVFTYRSPVCLRRSRSLERVLDFMDIDHEPKSTERGTPPAYWPSSGAIRAENLSARYSDGACCHSGPEHNLIFHLQILPKYCTAYPLRSSRENELALVGYHVLHLRPNC